MYNENQLHEQVIRSGQLSDPDPQHCDCGGHGWILHPADVWIECPCHRGMPHPEDYEEELTPEEKADADRRWKEYQESIKAEEALRAAAQDEDKIPF